MFMYRDLHNIYLLKGTYIVFVFIYRDLHRIWI
jgi:hypothetical protein